MRMLNEILAGAHDLDKKSAALVASLTIVYQIQGTALLYLCFTLYLAQCLNTNCTMGSVV